MGFFASQRFFSLWFGLGLPPLAVGAVVIGFTVHGLLGLFTLAVLIGFGWVRARNTCCRCSGYGSVHCGLPSLIAPLLARRQSAASFSVNAVRLHLGLDLVTMVFFNVIYCFSSWLPLSLSWSVVACLIVFIPRRHHGLLHKLRREPVSSPLRISLPVVANTPTKEPMAASAGN